MFCISARVAAFAQTSGNKTTVNENFELNIARERIIENEYVRSTDVRLNDETKNGLRLEVGVRVRAEQINLLLSGIIG